MNLNNKNPEDEEMEMDPSSFSRYRESQQQKRLDKLRQEIEAKRIQEELEQFHRREQNRKYRAELLRFLSRFFPVQHIKSISLAIVIYLCGLYSFQPRVIGARFNPGVSARNQELEQLKSRIDELEQESAFKQFLKKHWPKLILGTIGIVAGVKGVQHYQNVRTELKESHKTNSELVTTMNEQDREINSLHKQLQAQLQTIKEYAAREFTLRLAVYKLKGQITTIESHLKESERNLAAANSTIEKKNEEIADLSSQVKSLDDKLKDMTRKRDEIQKELEKKEASWTLKKAVLEAQLASINQQAEETRSHRDELQTKLDKSEMENKKMNRDLGELTGETKGYQSQIKKLQKEVKVKSSALRRQEEFTTESAQLADTQRKQLLANQEYAASLQKSVEKQEAELTQVTESLTDLENQYNKLVKEKTEADSEYEANLAKSEELAKQIKKASSKEKEQLQTELEEAQEKVTENQEVAKGLAKLIKNQEISLQTSRNTVNDLTTQLKNKKLELATRNGCIEQLTKERESLDKNLTDAYSQSTEVINDLLDQQEKDQKQRRWLRMPQISLYPSISVQPEKTVTQTDSYFYPGLTLDHPTVTKTSETKVTGGKTNVRTKLW